MEYIYDYYRENGTYPSVAELKNKLSCFRDFIAYRIVVCMPRCHLKPGEDQEQASIRYLYEIANVLPGFLEERGFTAESAQGVKLSTSDQLNDDVKPYYRDYICGTSEYGYQSLHITFYDNSSRSYMEVQLRTQKMDDTAEIGPANHLGYEKRQQDERARRDVIPERNAYLEAYERGMKLLSLELADLDVNMFSAVNNSLINDGCGLLRGRLILPYEHLSRFQNDVIEKKQGAQRCQRKDVTCFSSIGSAELQGVTVHRKTQKKADREAEDSSTPEGEEDADLQKSPTIRRLKRDTVQN